MIACLKNNGFFLWKCRVVRLISANEANSFTFPLYMSLNNAYYIIMNTKRAAISWLVRHIQHCYVLMTYQFGNKYTVLYQYEYY